MSTDTNPQALRSRAARHREAANLLGSIGDHGKRRDHERRAQALVQEAMKLEQASASTPQPTPRPNPMPNPMPTPPSPSPATNAAPDMGDAVCRILGWKRRKPADEPAAPAAATPPAPAPRREPVAQPTGADLSRAPSRAELDAIERPHDGHLGRVTL